MEIMMVSLTLSLYLVLSPLIQPSCQSSPSLSAIEGLSINGKFGLNIYGWMDGDFGGGTTARCLVQSLLANNISLSAVTINGADLHSHTNQMIRKLNIPTFPQNYLFDLLAINAANTIPILQDASNRVGMNHYRIGLWHWETSTLPLDQGELGGYYDEIWAPSDYVANAILSTSSFPSTVRVSVVPYGYETLSEFVTSQRRYLARGQLFSCIPSLQALTITKNQQLQWSCSTCSKSTIPNMLSWSQADGSGSDSATTPSTTLFLVIFDFNSDFQRKNILGIISAFHTAFPHSGDSQHTGLILKSSNAQHQPADFTTLLSLLDHNSDDTLKRIVLMDGILSSTLLVTLKRSVDCYISLHRSEGWGLNLLEAVMMGVPVIHSAFGGSEQFMKPLYEPLAPELRIPCTLINVSLSLSLSVSLTSCQITRPFGPYTTAMQWAEPSQGAAVHALIQIHHSLPRYHSLAQIIRRNAIALLSPTSTGEVMLQRLQHLSYCLCHISEHHSSFSLSFSSSSNCHPTVHEQNQLIEQTILTEILQHSSFSSSSQHHQGKGSEGGDESEAQQQAKREGSVASDTVTEYCQRAVLGKRVLKEKHKRLK
jgi:glycosyltransferase involved in cell wall biosynthesis